MRMQLAAIAFGLLTGAPPLVQAQARPGPAEAVAAAWLVAHAAMEREDVWMLNGGLEALQILTDMSRAPERWTDRLTTFDDELRFLTRGQALPERATAADGAAALSITEVPVPSGGAVSIAPTSAPYTILIEPGPGIEASSGQCNAPAPGLALLCHTQGDVVLKNPAETDATVFLAVPVAETRP
ncbi:hypothetical protein ACRARG_06010 [Pseudooceanicola sp. C21-150M6]|uniref:hypothetical protein n=1 Tax=Pseudooceanicola sp. C21-150M6 TaxID=3434355 RepID=UPI003D7FA258